MTHRNQKSSVALGEWDAGQVSFGWVCGEANEVRKGLEKATRGERSCSSQFLRRLLVSGSIHHLPYSPRIPKWQVDVNKAGRGKNLYEDQISRTPTDPGTQLERPGSTYFPVSSNRQHKSLFLGQSSYGKGYCPSFIDKDAGLSRLPNVTGTELGFEPYGRIPQPMFLATEPNNQALHNLWP